MTDRPRPRERRAGATRARSLPIAAVLFALWGVAAVGLRTVFSPGAWSITAFCLVATMCLVAGVAATALPRRRWLAVLLGIAASAVLAAAALTLTGRIALWRDDLPSALRLIRDAVLGGAAPLDVGGPLADVLVAALSVGCALTLIIALPLRSPVIAGLVPSVLLLAPAAVTGSSAGPGAFVAAGVMLALLAWLRAPALTWGGPVAAVAAVAVAVATFALVPPSRDRVWNTALVLGPVSSTVPDVTVALAEDLRQHNEISAFSFRSTEAGPVRFALATLADFEGGRWQPQDDARDDPLPVDAELDATGPVPAPATDEPSPSSARVTVTVQGLVSSWLPVPQSQVQALSPREDSGFDPREWEWAADSATARSDDVLTRTGMSYSARYTQLNADQPEALSFLGGGDALEVFEDQAAAPTELRPFLELPGELPEDVRLAAAQVTAAAADRLSIPFLLQSWFRNGDFTYDESAPYEPGTDPDAPYAVMESFLETRSGFCVHYASTFAVMARSLGVPTRIAVGYAANAAPDRSITVRSTDLHAWPEVYFDDIGWVAFEPTPGVGTERAQPDDTGQDGEQPETPQDEEQTQEPEEAPAPATTDPVAPPEASDGATGSDGDASGDRRATTAWAAAAGGALIVLALLLIPAAARLLRRRSRMTASEQGRGNAVDAWREVNDTALDLGLAARGSPPRARTPDAFVDALAERNVLAGDALRAARAIVAAANAERFGDGAPTALRDEIARDRLLRVAVDGLRGSASLRARIVAALAPRSLLTRAR